MGFFMIDADKCKRTGFCVAECPRRILAMPDPAAPPVPVEGAEAKCIRCGHCVAVCPHGAIELEPVRISHCKPVDKALALSPEHAEHFLRARRSIRSYKDKPVDRAEIERLIDIARYAPTGTNSQQVGWLAVNRREDVMRLSGLAVQWMDGLIKAANPMAAAYGMDGIVRAFGAGIDIICRGAPALVITHAPTSYGLSHTDSTIALTFLDLAAPTIGLGTCWAGFLMVAASQHAPLREALALPDGRQMTGAMMLGYPRFAYRLMPPRNEPSITWWQG